MVILNNNFVLDILPFLKALYLACRLETILVYNIGYFIIIIALLFVNIDTINLDRIPILMSLFFLTVMFAKAQASIADTICDYKFDKENSEKKYVYLAANFIGLKKCSYIMYSFIIISLLLAILLGIISSFWVIIGMFFFNLLGYYYSYPPRFKEKGIWNIIITSIVDVLLIIFLGYYIITESFNFELYSILILVFFYSASFHIMHMVGDVYIDKLTRVRTVATKLGIKKSLLFSGALGLIGIPFCFIFPVFSIFLLIYSLNIFYLYNKIRQLKEKEQSDKIANSWSIKIWAPFLNFSLSFSIFVSYFLDNIKN